MTGSPSSQSNSRSSSPDFSDVLTSSTPVSATSTSSKPPATITTATKPPGLAHEVEWPEESGDDLGEAIEDTGGHHPAISERGAVLRALLVAAGEELGGRVLPNTPPASASLQDHTLSFEWEAPDRTSGREDVMVPIDHVPELEVEVGTGGHCQVRLPESTGLDRAFGDVHSSEKMMGAFPEMSVSVWSLNGVAEIVSDVPGYDGPKGIHFDDDEVELPTPCVDMLLSQPVDGDTRMTKLKVMSNGIDIFTGWRAEERLGGRSLLIQPSEILNSVVLRCRTYAKVVKFVKADGLAARRGSQEFLVLRRLKEVYSSVDEIPVAEFLDEGTVGLDYYELFVYVPGWSLEYAMHHKDFTEASLLLRIMEGTGAGVKFCQDRGIFVPDLSPKSFRFDGPNVQDSSVKLVGFGNSVVVERDSINYKDCSELKFDWTRPPEALANKKSLDFRRAGVYSLGVIWYRLLFTSPQDKLHIPSDTPDKKAIETAVKFVRGLNFNKNTATQLFGGVLARIPRVRLASVAQVLQHPFFTEDRLHIDLYEPGQSGPSPAKKRRTKY